MDRDIANRRLQEFQSYIASFCFTGCSKLLFSIQILTEIIKRCPCFGVIGVQNVESPGLGTTEGGSNFADIHLFAQIDQEVLHIHRVARRPLGFGIAVKGSRRTLSDFSDRGTRGQVILSAYTRRYYFFVDPYKAAGCTTIGTSIIGNSCIIRLGSRSSLADSRNSNDPAQKVFIVGCRQNSIIGNAAGEVNRTAGAAGIIYSLQTVNNRTVGQSNLALTGSHILIGIDTLGSQRQFIHNNIACIYVQNDIAISVCRHIYSFVVDLYRNVAICRPSRHTQMKLSSFIADGQRSSTAPRHIGLLGHSHTVVQGCLAIHKLVDIDRIIRIRIDVGLKLRIELQDHGRAARTAMPTPSCIFTCIKGVDVREGFTIQTCGTQNTIVHFSFHNICILGLSKRLQQILVGKAESRSGAGFSITVSGQHIVIAIGLICANSTNCTGNIHLLINDVGHNAVYRFQVGVVHKLQAGSSYTSVIEIGTNRMTNAFVLVEIVLSILCINTIAGVIDTVIVVAVVFNPELDQIGIVVRIDIQNIPGVGIFNLSDQFLIAIQ